MASYAEFSQIFDSGARLKRLHYVSGSEARLREIVVTALRERAEVGEAVTVIATGDNDKEIWAELNQHPAVTAVLNPDLEPGELPSRTKRATVPRVRHVTVRSAHLMHSFRQLDGWMRQMRYVTCAMESGWPEETGEGYAGEGVDITQPLGSRRRCWRGHSTAEDGEVAIRKTRTGAERRWCAECLRVRKVIVTRGQLVRCDRPRTQHGRTEAVRTVAGWAACSRLEAQALLERVGWSVTAAWEATAKLGVLGWPLRSETIEAAAVESVARSFEEALRCGDRAAAASVAHAVAEEAVESIIANCERWLGLVARATSAVRAGRTIPDLVRLLDVDWITAERLVRDATRYTPLSTHRATLALHRADVDWHKEGGRVGVLETLAASW